MKTKSRAASSVQVTREEAGVLRDHITDLIDGILNWSKIPDIENDHSPATVLKAWATWRDRFVADDFEWEMEGYRAAVSRRPMPKLSDSVKQRDQIDRDAAMLAHVVAVLGDEQKHAVVLPPVEYCQGCAAGLRQPAVAMIDILLPFLSPVQRASAMEQYEHICVQKGWKTMESITGKAEKP